MNAISAIEQTSSQQLLGNENAILAKNDFLNLLVAQLRNQNPLDPVSGEEFSAQLAQFSSLEQLNNINTNLENTIELDLLLNQAINNTMATTLIGKTVKAVGNSTYLHEGEKTSVHFNLSENAKTVTLEIKDENGVVVRSVELSGQTAGDQMYEWDGKNDEGFEMPPGEYRFDVQARDVNDADVEAMTYVAGLITSIRYQNGNAVLRIGNLQISMASVLEIGMD